MNATEVGYLIGNKPPIFRDVNQFGAAALEFKALNGGRLGTVDEIVAYEKGRRKGSGEAQSSQFWKETPEPNLPSIPPGEYQAVIAHVHQGISRADWRFVRLTWVIVSFQQVGSVVFGFCSENPNGRFIYEEVVDDIAEFQIGQNYMIEVRDETDQHGNRTNRTGRISGFDETPPRTIHHAGLRPPHLRGVVPSSQPGEVSTMSLIEHDLAEAQALIEQQERHLQSYSRDNAKLHSDWLAMEAERDEARSQLRGAVERIKGLRERVNDDDPDRREREYARGYRSAVADALEVLVRGR